MCVQFTSCINIDKHITITERQDGKTHSGCTFSRDLCISKKIEYQMV